MGLYPKVEESISSGLPQDPDGQIFYVDSQEGTNSLAGGRGTRREKPFETITYALAQCVDNRNDVIFVTTAVQVEDQPIVVNKTAVHIIGLPNNSPRGANEARCWIFPDSHVSGGVFTISAGDVVIKNFMLWGTAGEPCIDFGVDAQGVRQTIVDCSFHLGSYGIKTGPAANQPSHYLAILGCHFGPTLTSGGILHASNGSWPLIEDCYFESIAMPNISVTGGIAAGRIRRCQFMLTADDTIGGAIDMGNGTRWIISDNDANDATPTALSTNPYRDTPNTNAWFRNTVGGAGF
ncbi:hypothetical protein LCGC14_2072280, partial [marine sediment metagenome]